MKIYIAGKITGDLNYKEKFAAAERHLKETTGATVISPAVLPGTMKKADYMRIRLAMMDSADLVVFLPDWEDSPGASLEMSWCRYIGKPIMFMWNEENDG